MAKKLKWRKHDPRKKVGVVVEVDHLEVVEEVVVDSEAEIVVGSEVGIEEMIEEMIAGMIEEEVAVELASIATKRVIWQEIVLMVIEGIADEVVAEVVLEAEVEVAEVEHVTIATKRVTWLENARKKIAEIVEDDRHKFISTMKGLQPSYHLVLSNRSG